MPVTRLTAIAAMTLLAIVVGPAAGQLIDPSPFATRAVPRADPFGDLPVNPATVDRYHVLEFLETLTAEQQTELAQRCQVIANDANGYEPFAVRLCFAVIVGAERLSLSAAGR